MIDKKAQGKASRAKGARFELKVRKELESEGWIVDKWTNNLCNTCNACKHEHDRNVGICNTKGCDCISKDFEPVTKLHPARSNRFNMRSTGFPDFITYDPNNEWIGLYNIIGVEAKLNGKLSKQEKEKCDWYLKNNIFSKILIAHNAEGTIEYKEYGNKG